MLTLKRLSFEATALGGSLSSFSWAVGVIFRKLYDFAVNIPRCFKLVYSNRASPFFVQLDHEILYYHVAFAWFDSNYFYVVPAHRFCCSCYCSSCFFLSRFPSFL